MSRRDRAWGLLKFGHRGGGMHGLLPTRGGLTVRSIGLPREPAGRSHSRDKDQDRDDPQHFRQEQTQTCDHHEARPDDEPLRVTRYGILQPDQPV